MNNEASNDIADAEAFTRRKLISGLAVTAAAATTVAAAADAAQGNLQRLQAVRGLDSPKVNGQYVFSNVVVSNRPRMVFVAGQLARDANGNVVGKGDIRAQMRQVCENIKAALAAVGGTLDDVAQISIFVTDWNEYRKALDVRQEYFGKSLPTATAVQVSALSSPDLMVEINAIAVLQG